MTLEISLIIKNFIDEFKIASEREKEALTALVVMSCLDHVDWKNRIKVISAVLETLKIALMQHVK